MSNMPSIFPGCLSLCDLSQGKCVGSKVHVLARSSGFEGGEVLERHWKSLCGHASILGKARQSQCALGLAPRFYGGPYFLGKPARMFRYLQKQTSQV